jgi:hypothetical protein
MANERNEPLQLNLGSLRSAMSLTLHTHHASRIWHGRAPTEGRPGIIGLNGYISVMNKMKRGAEQDDPYSDWWMLRIEDKLAPDQGPAYRRCANRWTWRWPTCRLRCRWART